MAWTNFFDIVVEVVGTPQNETEQFLIFLVSLFLAMYFLILIMDLFRLLGSFTGSNKR